MNYASLCSGIGALDLAVEAVFGAEPAWFAEIDRDASKVLARHWPGVPNRGDICDLDWGSAGSVDIMVSGPPCQPVSQAGQRKGTKDERFLWDKVLDGVEKLRPQWVVLENPPGIARFLPALGYRLAQSGYVGQAGVFSAAAIGACHLRERWFVLARTTEDPPGQPDRGQAGGDQALGAHAGRPSGGLGRPANGVPAAYSGSQAERQWASGPPGEEEQCGWWEQIDGDGTEYSGPALPVAPFVARMPDGTLKDYGPALARHAEVLGRPWPPPLQGRNLNGDFAEWMMMLPEGWLDGIGGTAKKRLAGNGVVPPQAEMALRCLLERLEAQDGSRGR